MAARRSRVIFVCSAWSVFYLTKQLSFQTFSLSAFVASPWSARGCAQRSAQYEIRASTQSRASRLAAPKEWEESSRPDVAMPEGETLPEAFLINAHRMGKAVAASDDVSGVLDYGTYLIGVLLFADFIRNNPKYVRGGRIGVMIPASAGFSLVAMGCLLAGCSIVMLNWTAGRANLEHMIAITGITSVLTSKRFINKIEPAGVDLSPLKDKNMLLYTDDIKENMYGGFGPLDKLKAAILSKFPTSVLKSWCNIDNLKMDSDAVVLFTSGSESMPKGVVLSHDNVLSNIKSVVPVLIESQDCLMGVLPPFHAFGFTVTSMLPVVTGVKVAYYANPLEYKTVAQQIAKWQPSVYIGTPTFASGMLKAASAEFQRRANDGQDSDAKYLTSSLRLVVTGAEKTPEDLFDIAEQQNFTLLEGYGVTECSPVLSVNRPGKARAGVGTPIPGTWLAIADERKYLSGEIEVIAVSDGIGATKGSIGKRGIVLAQGPNVFGDPDGSSPKAYLGIPLSEKNPFVYATSLPSGSTAAPGWWYDTGDLGFFDESGALILAGRLKRFVKIGGEMVSLPALEDALKKRTLSDGSRPWADTDSGAVIAVESYEADGERPVLGLLAAVDATLEEANSQLQAEGMPSLARLKIKIDSRDAFEAKWVERGTLPLLGSGKSDYAQMKVAIKSAALA